MRNKFNPSARVPWSNIKELDYLQEILRKTTSMIAIKEDKLALFLLLEIIQKQLKEDDHFVKALREVLRL